MRLQAQTESIPFSLTDEYHVSVFEGGTLPGGPVLQLNECGWVDASGTNDRYGLQAAYRSAAQTSNPWLLECQLLPSTHVILAHAANAHFPPDVSGAAAANAMDLAVRVSAGSMASVAPPQIDGTNTDWPSLSGT